MRRVTFPAPLVHRKEKPRVAAGLRVEAPGIEPFAAGVENGRKRRQTDGNGRGSAPLSRMMRPFATGVRPDATASVYQVYQGRCRHRSKHRRREARRARGITTASLKYGVVGVHSRAHGAGCRAAAPTGSSLVGAAL